MKKYYLTEESGNLRVQVSRRRVKDLLEDYYSAHPSDTNEMVEGALTMIDSYHTWMVGHGDYVVRVV
jgi:hypothetical protein